MKKEILLTMTALLLVVAAYAQRPRPRTEGQDRARTEWEYRRDRERPYDYDRRDARRDDYRRDDYRDARRDDNYRRDSHRGFIHPHHRGYYSQGRYHYYKKQGKKWRAYQQCTCPHCRHYFAPRRDWRYDDHHPHGRRDDPGRRGRRN